MLKIKIPELKYVSYRNRKLAYRETGVGPVLFLLHGMNGSSKSWANVFWSLGISFRVIAWDAPSFGRSDIFGDNIHDYKNAAKAFMNCLRIKEAILVGHSMGGVVATQLATDEDVSTVGLVLSSTHLGFGRPKGEPLMVRYSNRIKTLSNSGADMDYTTDRAKRSTPKGTPNSVIEFLAYVAKDARIEGIRDGGRMSQEADNTEICNELKLPVLILSGSKDTIISTEMHAALLAAIPSAKKVVIPKAGHASYAEYPDQFNHQVKEFAKKVWGLKTGRDNQNKINEREEI